MNVLSWVSILTICLSCLASAKTITVDDDNPADFSSIQAAIDAAQAGDIIQVAAGIYSEVILLKSGLALQGAGRNETIISGLEKFQDIPGSIMKGKDIENGSISFFTLDGIGKYAGVLLNGVRNFEISQNLIRNYQSAISIYNSRSLTVKDNVIQNGNSGMWINFSKNITIRNNVIKNQMRDAIDTDAAYDIMITNNTFNNCGVMGVFLGHGGGAIVRNNVFDRIGQIAINSFPAGVIKYNEIRNSKDGIHLKLDKNVEVLLEGNRVDAESRSLLCSGGSDKLKIRRNYFISKGRWSIDISEMADLGTEDDFGMNFITNHNPNGLLLLNNGSEQVMAIGNYWGEDGNPKDKIRNKGGGEVLYTPWLKKLPEISFYVTPKRKLHTTWARIKAGR